MVFVCFFMTKMHDLWDSHEFVSKLQGTTVLSGQIHSGVLWADCMAGPVVADFTRLNLKSYRSHRVESLK